jgi:DNA invertase Pin-like site-specific DNA recombinase
MSPVAKKLVAYFRVSTEKQGRSGLGLEGQQAAFQQYLAQTGGKQIGEYVEIETGTCKRHRPQLQRAIAHARCSGAVLVIAKLDRLARNVHFVSGVMESGIEFVACDNPHANRLTLHILAAVAEDEAVRISERTKAALAAAKRRGTKLGSARPGHWDGREDRRREGARKGGAAAALVHKEAADEVYDHLAPLIAEMRTNGQPLQAIADKLNQQNHTTRRGKAWNRMQVLRVIRRQA